MDYAGVEVDVGGMSKIFRKWKFETHIANFTTLNGTELDLLQMPYTCSIYCGNLLQKVTGLAIGRKC